MREVGYLPRTPASHWCKAALKSVNSLVVEMLEVRVASVTLENSLKETDADTGSWELAGTHWNGSSQEKRQRLCGLCYKKQIIVTVSVKWTGSLH